MISVELKDGARSGLSEVVICMDDAGLDYLVRTLSSLRGQKEHIHLKTPAWAGDELSETRIGGSDMEVVNHLRIVKL